MDPFEEVRRFIPPKRMMEPVTCNICTDVLVNCSRSFFSGPSFLVFLFWSFFSGPFLVLLCSTAPPDNRLHGWRESRCRARLVKLYDEAFHLLHPHQNLLSRSADAVLSSVLFHLCVVRNWLAFFWVSTIIHRIKWLLEGGKTAACWLFVKTAE